MKFPALITCITTLALTSAPLFAGALEDGKAAFGAGQYDQALSSFGKGFGEGDAQSGYFLARMLELGLGVSKDPQAAARLYRQAAEGGSVEAQNRLALLHYQGGLGVAQDYTQAARLFEQAAAQGNKNALFNLGKLHFEGNGVAKDPVRALELYTEAATKDHILALNTLGALYQMGAKSDADTAAAKGYFARSAAYGNAVGLYETARFTLQEGSAPEQLIDTHMYLNLASARSHPNAPEALQLVTDQMTPEEIAMAQQKARDFVALTSEAEQ